MTAGAKDGVGALSEKEKQTLRLMVRGHDAKSIARSLNLSVHTINERLRDARRKLAVSSSREAARLLFEAENSAAAATSQSFGDQPSGEDAGPAVTEVRGTPIVGAGRRYRPFLISGVLAMSVLLALLALGVVQPVAPGSGPASTTAEATDPQVVDSARAWLELVDQARWDESYRATASSFRSLNSAETWAQVSERVRTPLGRMVSRTLISQENLPAPPHGYEVVKFRTHFANKAEAVETVSLDRENGVWRVVGVTVG